MTTEICKCLDKVGYWMAGVAAWSAACIRIGMSLSKKQAKEILNVISTKRPVRRKNTKGIHHGDE